MRRPRTTITRGYREAVRRQNPDEYINCPRCKKTVLKENSVDAYACTRCGEIFTATGLEQKARRKEE